MIQFLKKASGVAALLAGVFASTWTSESAAQVGHTWTLADNGSGSVEAKAAAIVHDMIIVLDGNDDVLGQGYRIRRHGYGTTYLAKSPSDGRGTSLAVDEYNRVYTVARDNRVWFSDALPGNWSAINNNRCSGGGQPGGTIAMRQTVGDNNISVGGGELYGIDSAGRVNWWAGGGCWHLMSPLPSGTARSIAVAPDDDTKVWAINGSNEIYEWGSSWTRVYNGNVNAWATALAAGGLVAGSVTSDLFQFNTANDTFYYMSAWTHGTVRQLFQKNDRSMRVAVRPNGAVYRGTYSAP